MKFLVTGCAGFIGSHLTERLLAEGHEVIGVDNFEPYYPFEFKWRNLQNALKSPRFTFESMDLRNRRLLDELFTKNKIDTIVHLAAKAGVRPSIEHPLEYEESNVVCTINMLEAAVKHDVNKLIFGSSSSVYGHTSKVPFSEDDTADRPLSPYGASKRACEIFCYTYGQLYGLPITCLRFFSVYGPRQRPDMAIHKFTKLIENGQEITVYGDGTTKRDYTYVDDIVAGILAATRYQTKYDIFNLGNHDTVELRRVIALLEEQLGKKAAIRHMPMQKGEADITYADVSKARRLLGWSPSVPIEVGLKRFVEWYLTNPRIR